jgi:hypothetical protein
MGDVREFPTGATRDQDTHKIDPEGFLSPLVIQMYCEYMHKQRFQSDGQLRASDNWQKGIPLDVYMKSMWRHFLTVWQHHRGWRAVAREDLTDALMGLLFNVHGYAHELLLQHVKELEGNRVTPDFGTQNLQLHSDDSVSTESV